MHKPLRLSIVVAAFAVAALAFAPAAMAAKVHFKKPAPTFVKNADFSVTASGTLTGLGNGDIRVIINATGTGGALCQNPGGQDKVPGQNPVAVNVSGQTDIPNNQVTNGNVGFSVTSAAPTQPTTEQAGCPGDNWSVVGFNVTYTSVTITVLQDSNGQNGVFDPPGTVVLQQTFQVSL
jgi:hypothetical protein